jgi:hypothetical protein
LDVANCQKLTDLELYECSSLTTISLTNCPALNRACVEACNLQGTLDLSGCPNLVDIRSASNAGLTNYHFGPSGAGPLVRHFCARTNPQFNPNIASSMLTNFYSLSEWYMWNCGQTGALTSVSSNLTDVEIHNNALAYADFSGQSNMWQLLIDHNALTNVVITNCTALQHLEAQNNSLTTNALDDILAFLDQPNPSAIYVDLSFNTFPSASGYTHYASLTNNGVSVHIDFPDPNNVPGPTNAVTFVTYNQQPHLEVAVTNSPTIIWHWGDGHCETNVTHSTRDFGQPWVAKTNYVIIDPPDSLISFGQYQNSGDGHIASVTNLVAFPNLDTLWLWQDNLVSLDITNCPSLRHLHLAGNTNTCSSAVVDKWFISLNGTVTNQVSTNNVFYYPSGNGPGTPTSASWDARIQLTNNNWNLTPWP